MAIEATEAARAALVLDFLQSLGAGPRPYAEVMEAWRTSCPRLTVWEDAVDQGLVARRRAPGEGATVGLNPAGQDHLARHRSDQGATH